MRTALTRSSRGAALSFRLSEAASVQLRIERRARRRWVAAGTVTLAGRRGANHVRFAGVVGRRRLPLGRVRVTLVAVDAAGNLGKPRRATARLV